MHTLADLAGNKTICVVSMIDKNSIKRGAVRQRRLPNGGIAGFRSYGAVRQRVESRQISTSPTAPSAARCANSSRPRDSRCFNAPAAWCIRRRRRKSWRARSAGAGQPAVGDRPRLSASSESPVGDLLRADLSDPLADPRLAGLQQAVGKERDLQLVSAGGAVAFSREGIDLAIRRNDFPIADDVVARPFLKERVGPVCRREHAATGRELRGTLLHTETRPHGATGVPTAASRSGRATSCVSNISISACRRRSPAPVSASARWRWWRMISSTARWWRHMALRLTGRIMC